MDSHILIGLWAATQNGNYHLANRLIYDGANVNEIRRTVFDRMTTLLHYAAVKSDIPLIRLFIKHGVNINARDSENRTPLHWAVIMNDHPDVIDVLISEGAIVDARDVYQLTPLLTAMGYGSKRSARKLIARGASIDAVGKNGNSTLHLALMSLSRNLSIVKFLISRGANVDIANVSGVTPLHYALEYTPGNTELIQLLLDNGADVNKKTRNSGKFPLYLASRHSFNVHLLLKRGARVNQADNAGNTALHNACKNEVKDVATLLVKFGADINARNCEGEVAFDLLPNSASSEATARVIIQEAVKREALGQFVYEEYKQKVQSDERYSRFDRECREEVERMRSEKIDAENSAVSYFDIFSKDEERLVKLARNKNIVTAFDSIDYLTIFWIYDDDLTAKFENAKERANFLMSVEDFLLDMFGHILPAPIVQKVAAYIKYGDIIENEL